MTDTLRRELAALADPAYKAFQQPLLPGVDDMLGVRLPALQKLSARLAKGDWQAGLAAPDATFEERMLRGLVIGRLPGTPQEILPLVRRFLPVIDNWSVCDSFCAGFKIAKLYKEEIFSFAAECAASDQEYTARVGAVLLLWYYADGEYLPRSLDAYRRLQCPAFYARMAAAWGYSVFAAADFEATIAAMRAAALPDEVWNKALQKMRESRRITPAQKQWCRENKALRPSGMTTSAAGGIKSEYNL